jgi:predicted transcriptional regulator
MRRNELSLSTAAEALGLSQRMVAHYRTGSRPIQKTVWLACQGWELLRERAA